MEETKSGWLRNPQLQAGAIAYTIICVALFLVASVIAVLFGRYIDLAYSERKLEEIAPPIKWWPLVYGYRSWPGLIILFLLLILLLKQQIT